MEKDNEKEEMKFLDEIASIGFANWSRNEQEELERQNVMKIQPD